VGEDRPAGRGLAGGRARRTVGAAAAEQRELDVLALGQPGEGPDAVERRVPGDEQDRLNVVHASASR
jgi:hypothetical protein